MPASNVIAKGAAVNFRWGLPDGVNITTYGRVQSFRSARGSEKEPLKDANGNTDGMIYYDLRTGGTLEAIIPAAGLGSAEIADSVQINGDTYLIEEFDQNWVSGAWAKVTLNLNHYDGIAVGGSSST